MVTTMNLLQKINMKNSVAKIGSIGLTCVLSMMPLSNISAQQSMSNYSALPPLAEKVDVNPLVMLTLSGDHQLFLKAYSDYDDLNNNKVLDLNETTYDRNFLYVGYFDSAKCYQYNGTENYFEPTANAPVNGAGVGQPTVTRMQYCPAANEWSGNFLNWATMTRMDIIRHVLYGGYRSTDTAEKTVLERAYLPNDAHSFAKYLSGDDVHLLTPFSSDPAAACAAGDTDCHLGRGITLCNTTLVPNTEAYRDVASQDARIRALPPLVRAVKGNYSLWATSERYQCLFGVEPENDREFGAYGGAPFGMNGNDPAISGIYAHSRNPRLSERTGAFKDYVVRVNVCGANSAGGSNDCKSYGSVKKPVGLIQNYAEDRNVDFGLMSRSFDFNKADGPLGAGVLRRNISKIVDEIDPETGQFLRPAESLVSSLDALRIVDYMFRGAGANGDDYYNHGTYNNTCPWHSSSFDEGKCRNWGNPFSQIMAESYRYFAAPNNGASITAASELTGLTVAEWRDPLPPPDVDSSCINFNVIGFNASAGSFDNESTFADTTPASLGIGANSANGAMSLRELTNRVGNIELVGTPQYFVGKATTLANELNGGQCTPKTIGEFGAVSGTCPDAPRLGGSYLMAGLAHYVKTHDVRGGQRAGSEFPINTYGVTMASNLPTIRVRNPNNESQVVHVIPACRNLDNFRDAAPVGNCALVDFRAIPDASGRINKYFVAWEDTEHGSDYDQDVGGIIEIRFNANGTFDVITSILGRRLDNEGRFYFTPDHMEFGFVISGSTNDGIYFPSWVNKNRTQHEWDAKATNFSFGVDAPESNFLEPPLYYAAKWGSYKETDGTDGPTLPSEWQGADGWPKGYTLVRRPDTLQQRLEAVLNELINKASTSTSASIESSRLAGEGLMLQTLYNPEITKQNKTVTWVGTLNGLFIDSNGNIREDSNPNNALDAADNFIEFVTTTDDSGQTLKFNRYEVGADGGPNRAQPLGERLDLEQLKTIWSARDALAAITPANIVSQRGTTELADNKRYIIAGLDQPGDEAARDGIVSKDEVVAFTPANIPAAVLDVPATDAENVINYVRGLEVEGYRSRTINWGSGEKVWRLGDIVHSTPSIVGRPADGYDAQYGDDSYSEFREKYRNRRNMVYVGANDGMLHAFNAGFYVKNEDGTHQYSTTSPAGESVRAHGLGAEMWAYVPYNLLPHLQWLTRDDYSHVYYMDSKIYTFDVNIFRGAGYDNNVYPNGWGTILVAGMRFGGGPYDLNLDGSPQTLRSAYVIMDITDPEQPPKLIAEITDAELGYTVGDVELVKRRSPNSYGSYLGTLPQNDWYLVFGSGPRGPHAVTEAISDQQAKLFYFDLKAAISGDLALTAVDVDATTQKSFVHAIKSVDWNRDYKDDMLYVGVLGDHGRQVVPAPANPYHGALKQVELQATGNLFDSGDVANLLTGTGTNLPFSGTPLTVRDRSGTFWVFANSGQFLVKQDLDIPVENKFFGIKVNATAPNNFTWLTGESVNINRLYPVTNDTLLIGSLGGVKVRTSGGLVEDLDDYTTGIAEEVPPWQGWYRDLEGNNATSFTRTAFLNETVVFNSYSPAVSSCQQRGQSSIYLLDMFTGLPQYRRANLFEKTDGPATTIENENFKEVGAVAATLDGVASDPAIVNNHVITQTDAGEISNIELDIPGNPARRAWREIPASEINITQ
jgi:Tfp pilus assembly protein, tip-associated adhesin PilY1